MFVEGNKAKEEQTRSEKSARVLEIDFQEDIRED